MEGCSLPAGTYVATSQTPSIDIFVDSDPPSDDRETVRPPFAPQDFAKAVIEVDGY